MADTFTNLVTRVRSLIPDADGDFATDADIGQWINEAYIDIADRLDCIEEEFTDSITGSTIDLPPSGGATVKRVQSLRVADADGFFADVLFLDDATFNSYADDAVDPGFTVARVYDETIELFPTPDTGADYTLRALLLPDTLSGSDQHELPMWCERKMVDFAAYRSFQKMGELSRGDTYLATYEQGLPAPALGKDRTIPGPLTLAPVFGPFDLDPQASHI